MPSAGKFTLQPARMFDFALYLLYRAAIAVVAILPLRLLFLIGNVAGFCAWIVAGKYRRLALHNLRIAFGDEKSPRERRRIAQRHFRHLGANLLCGIKLGAMPTEAMEKHVTVENFEAVNRQLRAGQPVVFLLSHLGNWELIAQILPRHLDCVRKGTVYQKLGNRFIDEHVRKVRGRGGVELYDRSEGFHKPIELLRSGGLVGILSDQHAGDQGLWTPFFGRLVSTTPLPALLAKRTGALLVAIALFTKNSTHWRIVAEPALDTTEDSIDSLTAKGNEIIATQIRRAPEDWFWVHNRWKTPRPKFLLARYKRGVHLPSTVSAKDLKPFRILIRSSNWLGDAAMSVPAVRAIKSGRPDAHITIAVPAKIASMWKLVPEVDEILPLKSKSLFAVAHLIRRQPDFDVAILFPNSLRVALEAWLGGIPRRVGYRGQKRSWLLNQIVREPRKPGPPEHQSNHYLRIALECGGENSRIPNPKPKVKNAQKERSLQIGLCPGAEYGPAKRWLPERFAEAAASITSQQKVQWILFGTAKDGDLGETIASVLGDTCINRIGQTTLDQLIDELRECRLLLTNDTGTMHLAALLGLPTVAIFGSTEPRLTGPLGKSHVILRHQVECSPCFLRECPIDFRCMKAVSVQEVVNAVMSILPRDDNPVTNENANTIKS
ncbi:MAG: lipopolysaccharide heptosyltransferase II [Verrucomicrobiota bacterium]